MLHIGLDRRFLALGCFFGQGGQQLVALAAQLLAAGNGRLKAVGVRRGRNRQTFRDREKTLFKFFSEKKPQQHQKQGQPQQEKKPPRKPTVYFRPPGHQ